MFLFYSQYSIQFHENFSSIPVCKYIQYKSSLNIFTKASTKTTIKYYSTAFLHTPNCIHIYIDQTREWKVLECKISSSSRAAVYRLRGRRNSGVDLINRRGGGALEDLHKMDFPNARKIISPVICRKPVFIYLARTLSLKPRCSFVVKESERTARNQLCSHKTFITRRERMKIRN